MRETVDDTRPLALDGRRDWVATARVWGKVIGVLTPAIVGALVAIWTAAGDARARAQSAKQLAEDGYQVTKEAVQSDRAARAELERRVVELEQALRAGSPDPHRRLRGSASRHPVSPPVVPATPPPKALPRDLDQAQRQVNAPPAPPAPRGDAGP